MEGGKIYTILASYLKKKTRSETNCDMNVNIVSLKLVLCVHLTVTLNITKIIRFNNDSLERIWLSIY